MVGMVGKSDNGSTIVLTIESPKLERDISFIALARLLVGSCIFLPAS